MKQPAIRGLVWLLVVAPLSCLPVNSAAHPGALDSSFGSGGRVFADVGASGCGHPLAVQPDGKLIVVGLPGFTIARFTADGSPDTTFGNGGKTNATLPGGSIYATAAAVQSDGKIVVAGWGWPPGGDAQSVALGRFNSDGSLDSGFGSAGLVVTNVGLFYNITIYDVAIEADGKILVAGTTGTSAYLARFNMDGSVDAGFGYEGVVAGGGEAWYSLLIQPDGKILAAGGAAGMGFGTVLMRCHSTGALDVSFGNGGIATTPVAGRAYDLALQSDGKMLVTASFSYDFAVLRFRDSGTLDTGFGNGGLVTTSFGPDTDSEAVGVGVQTDGKIVVVGRTSSSFSLSRYSPTGGLDTDFDCDGKVTTDVVSSSEIAIDPAFQADGKLVVAGFTGSGGSIALARYLMDGPSQCPDVSLSKTANVDRVNNRKNLTYTMAITNLGPGEANNVVLTDPLPTQLEFVSASSSQGGCVTNGQDVVCNVGTLPNGSNAVVSLVVKVLAPGGSTVTNTASVGASNPDLQPDNNSAAAETPVFGKKR